MRRIGAGVLLAVLASGCGGSGGGVPNDAKILQAAFVRGRDTNADLSPLLAVAPAPDGEALSLYSSLDPAGDGSGFNLRVRATVSGPTAHREVNLRIVSRDGAIRAGRVYELLDPDALHGTSWAELTYSEYAVEHRRSTWAAGAGSVFVEAVRPATLEGGAASTYRLRVRGAAMVPNHRIDYGPPSAGTFVLSALAQVKVRSLPAR